MALIWLYTSVSAVITTCFLTVLFILALFSNLLVSHFKGAKDKRDTRSSKTPIRPRKQSRVSSANSETPLSIEVDTLNNIEYDHIISSVDTRPATYQKEEPNISGSVNDIEMQENPFADVLNAEDLRLVPDLNYYYSQYGLQIDEYSVETEDGFFLDLWHLRLKNAETIAQDRHPMLLLHGLLQSSGSFASGGRKSLAYFLHQSGFDVWMGNNRCGFHPRWNGAHVRGQEKWNWDMNAMIEFDLKALVSSVLEKTHKPKITLIAHSQGTTQTFMGLVNGERIFKDGFNLNDKLENFVALAPAIYPGPLLEEKSFVKFMVNYINSPFVFGKKSFLPLMMTMRNLMVGSKLFSFLSYIMFNYLFDWNDTLWDRDLRDRHFLFSPVSISVKLMVWWLSSDSSVIGFNNGSGKIFPDALTFFPVEDESPKNGNEHCHVNKTRQNTRHFPRILMFIPKQDRLVDGERLINHFVNHEPHSLYKLWYIDEYSHLDVLWAHDVIERIGKPILANIRLPERPIP